MLFEQVNYYYYEVFMTLILLLEELGMKQDSSLFSVYRTIFLFLNSYQRIRYCFEWFIDKILLLVTHHFVILFDSKPQEFEKEQWYQMYPNEQVLPAISEYRLPFKLLYSRFSKCDPWKIISGYQDCAVYFVPMAHFYRYFCYLQNTNWILTRIRNGSLCWMLWNWIKMYYAHWR